MSLYLEAAFVLACLLALDGAAALLFHDRIEPWIRQLLPRIRLRLFAAVELAGGLLAAWLILRHG